MVLADKEGVKIPEWRKARLTWSRGKAGPERAGRMVVVDHSDDDNVSSHYDMVFTHIPHPLD